MTRSKSGTISYKVFQGWWRGEDSNLRRLRRQIYSLLPLAAREPLHLAKKHLMLVRSGKHHLLTQLINNRNKKISLQSRSRESLSADERFHRSTPEEQRGASQLQAQNVATTAEPLVTMSGWRKAKRNDRGPVSSVAGRSPSRCSGGLTWQDADLGERLSGSRLCRLLALPGQELPQHDSVVEGHSHLRNTAIEPHVPAALHPKQH